PGGRAVQDCRGGGGGLVVVDLGVGDPGVVVQHGVHERGAELWVAVPVAADQAGLGHRLAIAFALDASDVAPPAAVGDVAQLLDIDVDQGAGPVVLVAAGGAT